MNVRTISISPTNKGLHVQGEVLHTMSMETLAPIGTSTRAMEEVASSTKPDWQIKQQFLVSLEMKQLISSRLLPL